MQILQKNLLLPLQSAINLVLPNISATAILKILKEHEYIEHCPSQVDGRSYTITVTEKGKKLIETACNEYTKSIELIRTKMGTKDFEQLLRLICKANAILKENMRLNEMHT